MEELIFGVLRYLLDSTQPQSTGYLSAIIQSEVVLNLKSAFVRES